MPYASRAQQGLFHSPNSPVSAAVVKDFDDASRGQKGLPYHASNTKKKKPSAGMAKAFASGRVSKEQMAKRGYDAE